MKNDAAWRKLKAAAAKLNAELHTYLGATDVVLPDGPWHFAATGTKLISGDPESLLADIAHGLERCTEACDHWWFDPAELVDIARKCGVE